MEENITNETTYETWTPELSPAELALTKQKIEKINARAAKRGFSGKLELTYERVERKEMNAIGLPTVIVRYKTQITGKAPCYNGWKFLARIDVMPNSKDFTLATAPGVDVIDRKLVKVDTCEHCNSNRYRKNIYLVQNLESGDIKNVGSTCIKDFLGWNTSFSFISVQDIKAEILGGSYQGEEVYTVDTVLAAAYLAIKEFGWVPSSEMWKTPTKWITREILDPKPPQKGDSPEMIAQRVRIKSLSEHIPEAVAKVPAMIDWVNSLDDSSNFNINLKAAIAAEEVGSKQIGILAFVPEGYARHLGKVAEWEAKAKLPNDFIGKVGDKVEVSGTIRSVKSIPTNFGVSTLYTILTDIGIVKWFASSPVLGEDTEVPVKLKGTVKKHEVWKDSKSTVLTRCKQI